MSLNDTITADEQAVEQAAAALTAANAKLADDKHRLASYEALENYALNLHPQVKAELVDFIATAKANAFQTPAAAAEINTSETPAQPNAGAASAESAPPAAASTETASDAQ